MHTDGACKGNPGPSSVGVVIVGADGTPLAELSEQVGTRTNNEAEYLALIRGVEEAMRLGLSRVRWVTDSELLHRQWTGAYKVKASNLVPLLKRARELAAGLDEFEAVHVRRLGNRRADELANAAFAIAKPAQPSANLATIYTDAVARGNPGPAAVGVLVLDEDGTTLAEVSEFVGRRTSNEAEYLALIRGLEEARLLGLRRVRWLTKSQLVLRQWTGEYSVKAENLSGLLQRARSVAAGLEEVAPVHVSSFDHPVARGLARGALRVRKR
jgi:ribonuclease HI